jgi:hypothetical protein
MKLNRILLQWKVQVRKTKVVRLRFTIISHAHYRRQLTTYVDAWKLFITQRREVKDGIASLAGTIDKSKQR